MGNWDYVTVVSNIHPLHSIAAHCLSCSVLYKYTAQNSKRLVAFSYCSSLTPSFLFPISFSFRLISSNYDGFMFYVECRGRMWGLIFNLSDFCMFWKCFPVFQRSFCFHCKLKPSYLSDGDFLYLHVWRATQSINHKKSKWSYVYPWEVFGSCLD